MNEVNLYIATMQNIDYLAIVIIILSSQVLTEHYYTSFSKFMKEKYCRTMLFFMPYSAIVFQHR